MPKVANKTLLQEVVAVFKAVTASVAIIGMLVLIGWNVKGEELVDCRIQEKMNDHVKENDVYIKQIMTNAKDVVQLKELSMQTHLLIKQLTTDEMERRADKEFDEIKRRQ